MKTKNFNYNLKWFCKSVNVEEILTEEKNYAKEVWEDQEIKGIGKIY